MVWNAKPSLLQRFYFQVKFTLVFYSLNLRPPCLAAMTELIAASIVEAHRLLARKFHGSPCSNCGSTIRYLRGGGCVACVKTRALDWQKQNPDAGRDRARRHYQQSKKVRAAWVRDCAATAKAAVKHRPIDEALKLAAVRDLLLAWGAIEVPAEKPPEDDFWGGL